jgi:hypothetical protein
MTPATVPQDREHDLGSAVCLGSVPAEEPSEVSGQRQLPHADVHLAGRGGIRYAPTGRGRQS